MALLQAWYTIILTCMSRHINEHGVIPDLTQLCEVQIILLRDVQGIGKQGELAKVVNGYWYVP